ncbi:MAG: mechanosensitive ion channel domain-containing protein [Pseudomonadota bacterium]
MFHCAAGRATRESGFRHLAWFGWLCWLCLSLAWSAEPGPPTEQEITARINALAGDESLSEAQREAILAEYRRALDALLEAARHRERLEAVTREAQAAPARTRELERRIAGRRSPVPPDPSLSYQELDRQVGEANAELGAAQIRAQDAARREEQLERAPLELQQTLAAVQAERAAALGQAVAGRALSQEEKAREALRLAQLAAWDAQLAALHAELDTLEPRLALARAERRWARAELEDLEARAAQLQRLLDGRRQAIVEQVREQALQLMLQAEAQPAAVAAETRANAGLASRLADLIARLDEIAETRRELRARFDELQGLYDTAVDQLEIAQLGGALGRVLHQQRQQLPSLIPRGDQLRQRGEAIALARFDQLQLRTELKHWERAPQLLEERLRELPAAEREQLRPLLGAQWATREQLLERLDRTYTAYIADLGALDKLERELIQLSGNYSSLLNRNLVWIADVPRLDWRWPLAALAPLLEAANPRVWRELAGSVIQSWQHQPGLSLLGLAVVVLAYAYRRFLRARLSRLAEWVNDPDRDRFSNTLVAALISLALALPVPLTLGFGALLLRAVPESGLSQGLAAGLRDAAWVALVLELARVLCRDRGLLDAHLGWSAGLRRRLAQPLYWLLPVAVVAVLAVGATNALGQQVGTLGRAGFVVWAVALSGFIWRALHPVRGLLSAHFVEARRHGWQWQLWPLWFGLFALTPLATAVLALAGYYYTAQQVLERFCATGVLLLAVALARQIALRGLGLFEVRIARRQALARRDAARQREVEAETQGEATVEIDEVQAVDVAAVHRQVSALLRIVTLLAVGLGAWWIWADLLPALEALREIVLWEYVSGSGDSSATAAVTAAGVGLALLVAALTYLAARNLPGLLEVTVLQRLEVDAGARYAANAVSRYLIVTLGVLVVVNLLGLEWGRLQWLVAALGVGLGFGLQEVVANFVSGLIILFERPFRIGDTVTVGAVSGTVTRIRIRATTITDWDRKELIVPNKAFITDQLVNWTLSDPVLRVLVKVGIAYGSDTALARGLLMEVAEANPRVLADPPPQVWFLGFGDSSLNFEVRAFVMGLPELLPATHELHEAIDATFRRHGVEIAFPQRDLHLRSLDPRVAELLRGQSLPGGPEMPPA